MKNKQTKLSLNKFKIAKLNNSKSIIGGSLNCGDQTQEKPKVCVLTSDIWIDEE